MKITVQTTHPNLFINKARKLLRDRGHSQAHADELLNLGQFDGEQVSFTGLSIAQFCVLEDTAVREGLPSYGNQEDQQS